MNFVKITGGIEYMIVGVYAISGKNNTCMGKRRTKEEYIEIAKKTHGNKYNYSKLEYRGDGEKVCIICPIHGEFWQHAGSHINGAGCPKCAGLKKMTTEEFIIRAKKKHGERYDYSNVVYNGKRKKVQIICPIHGEFEQLPLNHIRGQGCPYCGKKFAQEFRKNDYQCFINESQKRFGNIYDFPNIETLYENSHSKIIIKCKKCGNIFEKIACDHLTSPHGGCLKCYSNKSKDEEEISEFISNTLGYEIRNRCRSIIGKNELDIFIPEIKVAIEYNGIYWHSNKKKDKNYHLIKLEECKNRGIKLIQIFEDEYKSKKEIVLSKLSHILKKNNSNKIYARKCNIRIINYNIAKPFLENNHIQGSCHSSLYLGGFYNEKLISVMSFKKMGVKQWELDRFASDIKYQCVGIGGKLFKYFIRNYNPEEVKSFADRRWTIDEDNNLYIQLGFKFNKYIAPDYKYYFKDVKKRFHKFNFRKQILHKKYGFPLTMTESEMTEKLGAYKIYDCGLIKYVWKK